VRIANSGLAAALSFKVTTWPGSRQGLWPSLEVGSEDLTGSLEDAPTLRRRQNQWKILEYHPAMRRRQN